IGKTKRVPATKLAVTPIGSPDPEITKYKIFFTRTTMTPASGEKINPANKAGISPKSISKKGGKAGNGNLIKKSKKEMVPNKAIMIHCNNLACSICSLPSAPIDLNADEGRCDISFIVKAQGPHGAGP